MALVPLDKIPQQYRAEILPGTDAFKAYATELERTHGLEPGTLSNAKYAVAPDIDGLALLKAAALDAKKHPVAPDPSEGGGTLQFGPWDTGIKTPQGVERTLAGIGKSFSDTGLGVKQALGLASQDEVSERQKLDKPLMDTGAGMAGNVIGSLAQTALPATGLLKGANAAVQGARAMRVANATRAGLAGTAAATVANPLTQGAIVGGGFSAAQPVEEGGSRGLNTATGAGLGAAGTGVTLGLAAAGRAAKDNAPKAVAALADAAEKYGIPLRAAQVSASKPLEWFTSALDHLPFGSGKKLSARQQEAFNSALSKTVGEDTPDALAALRQSRMRNDALYNRLKDNYNLQLEPWHVDHMKDAVGEFARMDRSQGKYLSKGLLENVKSIVKSADDTGLLDGRQYKTFRSDLGKDAVSASGDAERRAIKQIQYTLDSAFKSGLPPEEQAALSLADKQWANMRTLEKIAPKDASGDFDFTKLAPLLAQRNAENAANRMGYLYGQGDQTLPDLARIGTQFLARGPEAGPAWQKVAKRVGQTAFPVGAAAGSMYALNKDEEHPVAKSAAELAGLALASKMLGSANNSQWFNRGVPWLKKTGEGLTMSGLGQLGTGLHEAFRADMGPNELEEGQTP